MASSAKTADSFKPLDLTQASGHLIRRAQQVHTRYWTTEIGEGLTSPQFAVLTALKHESDLDQRRIGEIVSLDRSTMADVARRLEGRGLVQRVRDPHDGRRRVLALTPTGEQLLVRVTPSVERISDLLLAGLTKTERSTLLRLLTQITEHGEEAFTK